MLNTLFVRSSAKATSAERNTAFLTTVFALAFTFLAIAPADAQLSVEWIAQYGTDFYEVGNAITVDQLGRSWVTGYTLADLGVGQNGGLFLSRISAGGGVDFTRQNGNSGTVGNGVVLLNGNNLMIAGSSNSAVIDGQPSLGDYDGVTARYDTNGGSQGTTRFGSSAVDRVQSLAGNNSGLFAGGYTTGSFGGEANGGSNDGFISKLDNSGSVLWTRFAGTSGDDLGRGAAFDGAGNGYLTGHTSGSFVGFLNAGSNDLFVARYDSVGNRTLLKQLGTSASDLAYDVEADANGNIYITGATYGPLGGQTNYGSSDAYVMKLDNAGNVVWTRLLGSIGNEFSFGLALDGAGHLWIGGYSTGSFAGHSNLGGPDAFVAEYDTAGNILGTTFLATQGYDYVYGLAVGPDGSAFVTGYTEGDLNGANAGYYDVYVAKITGVPEPAGAVMFSFGALLLAARRRLLSLCCGGQ